LKQGVESHLIVCCGQVDRRAVARVRELVRETRADVVHAHGFKADIYAYLAMRGMGVPLVSTCHTWYDTDRMVRLYGALDRFVLRRYARVVAVSDEVRRRLLKAGVREERIRIVRNGIDLRPFEAAKASLRGEFGEAVIVGLVGRLAWEKGVDVFLRAAARVLAEFPEARFVVAGDGPDREKLEGLIGELGIGGVWQDAGAAGGHGGGVCVAGCDGVGVAAGGAADGDPGGDGERAGDGGDRGGRGAEAGGGWEDGRAGAAEDVEALAAGIAGLLRDPERRARLGAAAREMVRAEYSAERMAGEYLRVYEEAIGGGEAVSAGERRPRVFMMDLWATVPYYTAYLAKALLAEGEVDLQVGSMDYYLDPNCFLEPGDTGRSGAGECGGAVPAAAAAAAGVEAGGGDGEPGGADGAVCVSPPDVVHVQYLPMLRSGCRWIFGLWSSANGVGRRLC
jgi:glycosyltransferase involved in cell wall biosynthesis